MGKIKNNISEYGLKYTSRKIYNKLRLIRGEGWKICGYNPREMQSREIVNGDVKFSILVPLYNTPENFLREMIDSVVSQTYSNFQLCLADGSDDEHAYVGNICNEKCKGDERISYKKLQQNLGISENTNACIDMAEGDWFVLFDHDDLLHPMALEKLYGEIVANDSDMIYTDEAMFEGKLSNIISIHAKPGFSPDNLRANNYICHLCAFSRELQERTGKFISEYDGSQDHDYILRLTENATCISHIPMVLYYWRCHAESVAANIDAKRYALEAAYKAVGAHINRLGMEADIWSSNKAPSVYKIEYKEAEEKVPENNGAQNTPTEIIVVNDRSNKWIYTKNDIEKIRTKYIGKCEYVLLIKSGVDHPNDREKREMISYLKRDDVLAVGCMIKNKKERIVVGPCMYDDEGNIYNRYSKTPANSPAYMNRLEYANDVSLLAAGCVMIKCGSEKKSSVNAQNNAKSNAKNNAQSNAQSNAKSNAQSNAKSNAQNLLVYLPQIRKTCTVSVDKEFNKYVKNNKVKCDETDKYYNEMYEKIGKLYFM